MKIVVVALGKIGLPLAVQFAGKGHQVVGVDVNGDGISELDGTRIYYFGISYGGMYGPMLLAVEPSISAFTSSSDSMNDPMW